MIACGVSTVWITAVNWLLRDDSSGPCVFFLFPYYPLRDILVHSMVFRVIASLVVGCSRYSDIQIFDIFVFQYVDISIFR